jgi:phosphatidylserine synthase
MTFKRHLADLLSGANLACGIASCAVALQGRPDLSLLLLMGGGFFDGLDGLAARRWGGTKVGVLADDFADGVSNGVAPAAALWAALGGVEGAVLGLLFAGFVLTRLVFFTLDKGNGPDGVFRGLPSTAGAVVALSALVLFPGSPALVGLLVGAACVLLVAFDSRYRHIGRAVASTRRYRRWALGFMALVGLAAVAFGAQVSAAMLLLAVVGYGFGPMLRAFRQVGAPAAGAHRLAE